MKDETLVELVLMQEYDVVTTLIFRKRFCAHLWPEETIWMYGSAGRPQKVN